MLDTETKTSKELRELAAWYRDFAERAGSPWIWDGRMRAAEDLERQADMRETGADRRYALPASLPRIGP